MTHEQRQTLHRILLDAKAEIKDGKLYDHDGHLCDGICMYVGWHRENKNRDDIDEEVIILIDKYKKPLNILDDLGHSYIAPCHDFAHPDRLALLDWLINETKP